MSETILSIENLRIHFKTFAGEVQAIRGVNLTLQKGETKRKVEKKNNNN